MKFNLLIVIGLMATLTGSAIAVENTKLNSIRVATFNVSMEALNYTNTKHGEKPNVTGDELVEALTRGEQQIKNIAEIIQRVNPDIILLNEFDFTHNDEQAIKRFISQFLNKSQQSQKAVNFPYYYVNKVNTGVTTNVDLNGDGVITRPSDTHGFGYFPGHFGMVLLSKYPIKTESVRTFQKFKWKDMPLAMQPKDPKTNKPWYSKAAWQELRLSSKSHWDVPINVNNNIIHVLASHPTPPVFDGPEDRNGKRNHDEIRFWYDYISPSKSQYIYDDNQHFGGISDNTTFVILGDQNASAVEGGAIKTGIGALLAHPKVQDPTPTSSGGKQHSINNEHAKNHTAFWRMRADYVLPSANVNVVNSGIFWPEKGSDEFRLIESRQASSDHRLVWVDIQLPK